MVDNAFRGRSSTAWRTKADHLRWKREDRMRGLSKKRVLITGGASGIGAATAARFLREGSSVCVIDRDENARRSISRELPDLAGTLAADVSELRQVEAAFAAAVEI